MKNVTEITFAVKGSGGGGAGWIGKVEERDTPAGEPGRMGVYFGHPQEYTTYDENMIVALQKSGVAIELYREEKELLEPGDEGYEQQGVPAAIEKFDQSGNIKELEFMKLLDLKLLAKELGIALKGNQNKDTVIGLIRQTRAKVALENS